MNYLLIIIVFANTQNLIHHVGIRGEVSNNILFSVLVIDSIKTVIFKIL